VLSKLEGQLQSHQEGWETDQDSFNSVALELISISEKSLKRKNQEIEVIRSCLEREKEKLAREKQCLQKKVAFLKHR